MKARLQSVPFWLLGWLAITVGTLVLRPAFPIDESRYLAVAWEMWSRPSFWVPYLNGHLYDGKPPLFFWLMQAGWAVFGVSDWWARLVGPLFGLSALMLTARLGSMLWDIPKAAALAPTILLGSAYWALFSSGTMFDMLLCTFALLAIYGLVRVWRGGADWNFGLAGFALGLGILAKGPVIFLPVGSVALLAPWWMKFEQPQALSWRRWYRGLAIALAIAAAIVLLWMVPMTLHSGKGYFLDMTIHQTAGYTVNSFSHPRPLWWYLPVLPLMLFPWPFWPGVWRAAGHWRGLVDDPGIRLCIAWAASVLIIFSLISGKQPHYMLSIFPAVALLLARLLGESKDEKPWRWELLTGLLLAVGGIALLSLPAASHLGAAMVVRFPAHEMELAGAVVAVVGILWTVALGKLNLDGRLKVLAAGTWLLFLFGSWGLFRSEWPALDLRVPSAFIGELQRAGKPLAVVGSYAGEFSFYGRLQTPLTTVSGPAEVARWAQSHPDGYVIYRLGAKNWPPPDNPKPVYAKPYRGGGLAIWRATDVAALPYITIND